MAGSFTCAQTTSRCIIYSRSLNNLKGRVGFIYKKKLGTGRVKYRTPSSLESKSKLSKRLPSSSKKILSIVGIVLLVLLSLALLIAKLNSNHPQKETVSTSTTQTEVSQKEGVKDSSVSFDIAAVGDMLPHETVTKAAKTSSGYDYLNLISPELQTSFQKAPVRFCNQEAPSAPTLGVRGYPAFNAPAEFPRDLTKFGCNVVSLANNHANDSGQAGINGTVDEWSKQKTLAVSGANKDAASQQKEEIFEVNGIKFGFVAFNEINNNAPSSSYSINMLGNTTLLEKQIKDLKSKTDLVIVSVHWGQDGSHKILASQNTAIKKISSLGADLILGSGPHVWQPYQVLDRPDGGKTHVWYSLGNGLNSQIEQDQLFSGVALMQVNKDKDSKVSLGAPRVLPTYMHYIWTNGIGLAQSQLLGRKDLKWTALAGSEDLVSQRNDFKTTVQAQKDKLKSYINNDQVKLLDNY